MCQQCVLSSVDSANETDVDLNDSSNDGVSMRKS